MSINYSSQRNSNNISIGLTANGTTSASTQILGQNAFYAQLSTCTSAAHGIVLPKHPQLGVPYCIKNDGAWTALVFPHPGGTSTIDAATSFCLANNGSEASFVAVQSTPITANADNLTWHSFGKSGRSVITTTGAVTLSPSKHYDTQVNVSQAAAYAITIPDPEDAVGMKVEVVCEVEGANAVTISSGSADLSGIILLGDATKLVDQDTTMSMVATHCQIGDRCVLTSDGTNWSCMTMSHSVDANDGWVAS